MYNLILKILFLFPPEKAHYLTLNSVRFLLYIPGVPFIFRKLFQEDYPVEFLGLTFKNPVGLAAGFDKNAAYMKEFAALGFGFIEIGTVTPRPQAGNAKPRLFRLLKDNAVINRMGFNNDGVEKIADRLKDKPNGIIIGGNIGKNKDTPNEQAFRDYEICFRRLYDLVDYFVVNISSPNTPDLRALQDKDPLKIILQQLNQVRIEFVNAGKISKPILVKIAPDLSKGQISDIVETVRNSGLDGIVASNTTISRQGLKTPDAELATIGPGGLSGKPVREKADEILHEIKKIDPAIPVIGVGGIHEAEDAINKLRSGAGLVQLYTGFIYKGPFLTVEIIRSLRQSKG